jgi:hypothetical protein
MKVFLVCGGEMVGFSSVLVVNDDVCSVGLY